uniref:Protein GAST1 n=1 Tax=Solanum tuberosum TaxID=4113 RepID=M0ZLT6_SOLTU
MGTLGHLSWSSSYCSKGNFAYCHRYQQEHTDTLHSISGRKTYTASYTMSLNTDTCILVDNL